MIRFRKVYRPAIPQPPQLNQSQFSLAKSIVGHVVPLSLAAKPKVNIHSTESKVRILQRVLNGHAPPHHHVTGNHVQHCPPSLSMNRQQKQALAALRARVRILELEVKEIKQQDEVDREQMKRIRARTENMEAAARRRALQVKEMQAVSDYNTGAVEALTNIYDQVKRDSYEVPYFMGMRHIALSLAREIISKMELQAVRIDPISASHTNSNLLVSEHHIHYLDQCVKAKVFEREDARAIAREVLSKDTSVEEFVEFAMAAVSACNSRCGPGPMDEAHLVKAMDVLRCVHERRASELGSDIKIVTHFADKAMNLARNSAYVFIKQAKAK